MKLASYSWISCSNSRRKCNEHVRTQINIYRRYKSSKQMKLASYRWISCSKLRRKNEHVRTQIAIYRLYTSSKQMKIASDHWISCSYLRRKCNEHARTQIAIASKLITIIIVKNHAYLLLTAFADPS